MVNCLEWMNKHKKFKQNSKIYTYRCIIYVIYCLWLFFFHAVTNECAKNPEDLCCRNGMGKCAALIVGLIFVLFVCGFGCFWFKMKRNCRTNQPVWVKLKIFNKNDKNEEIYCFNIYGNNPKFCASGYLMIYMKKKIVRHVMFKLQFIFLVLFPFIFSIFVNCVGEPRGVGIHGAIWGAILSGSGKKQQSMFEFGRKITKTTKNFASKFFRKTKFQII